MNMEIYDFIVKDIDDKNVSLSLFKGKVMLIVNTATRCGFTPQYQQLEELYKKYKDRGLEILDFPCNQFANQAPETNSEIKSFCVLNYGVNFKQFKKINVYGSDAAPVFKFLVDKKHGLFGKRIKWNFTKFLISRSGEIVKRFSPMTNPRKIEKHILRLL